MIKPSFREESYYWNYGIDTVIGLDEVGRGSFAGPIVGAGVIYKPNFNHAYLQRVRDSKLLTVKVRNELSDLIKINSTWIIEEVDVDFINEYGIGKANKEVFNRILAKLVPKSRDYFILADGFNLNIPKQKGIIGGDNISLSIASASIIAKVYRDNIMINESKLFPEYKFDENKGYGTLYHRNIIEKVGLCKIHRTSFKI